MSTIRTKKAIRNIAPHRFRTTARFGASIPSAVRLDLIDLKTNESSGELL
jgi:hypothetical protein